MKTLTFSIALLFSSISLFAQVSAGKAQMHIPGVEGILSFDVGPTTFETRVRPDGKEVQLRAMERPDHLLISAFLQHVTFPASAEKCRDEWWPGDRKAIQITRDDLQETAVKDGIARVEFVVPEFQGVKVRQKEIHAYVGDRDLCGEIHLSRLEFKPADQALFEEFLKTVKLDVGSSSAERQVDSTGNHQERDSSYYFREGSKLFLQQNYAQATPPYQKALDLEKQHRKLSKDYFRVLIDNLGMSYGIGDNLAQAKATFEYGLTQDPEYPMFFYNLACVYGEMDKMNEAVAKLRLAYRYKANVIAGETLPDPIKDDSFRYFVGKNNFVNSIREMQK